HLEQVGAPGPDPGCGLRAEARARRGAWARRSLGGGLSGPAPSSGQDLDHPRGTIPRADSPACRTGGRVERPPPREQKTLGVVLTTITIYCILGLQSVLGRSPRPARAKREPGANPGLPRSGEQERTPSWALGRQRPGKRRLVGSAPFGK